MESVCSVFAFVKTTGLDYPVINHNVVKDVIMGHVLVRITASVKTDGAVCLAIWPSAKNATSREVNAFRQINVSVKVDGVGTIVLALSVR